jgi:hypothetical protein
MVKYRDENIAISSWNVTDTYAFNNLLTGSYRVTCKLLLAVSMR